MKAKKKETKQQEKNKKKQKLRNKNIQNINNNYTRRRRKLLKPSQYTRHAERLGIFFFFVFLFFWLSIIKRKKKKKKKKRLRRLAGRWIVLLCVYIDDRLISIFLGFCSSSCYPSLQHLPLHSTGLPFQVRYFENNNKFNWKRWYYTGK